MHSGGTFSSFPFIVSILAYSGKSLGIIINVSSKPRSYSDFGSLLIHTGYFKLTSWG